MSAEYEPHELNQLPNLNFVLVLHRMPHVTFRATNVVIPGISIGAAASPTPFTSLPVPGDHITFDQFSLTFNIDEKMQNYKEVFNWMMELGFPESYQDFVRGPKGSWNTSDATLSILDAKKNTITEGFVAFENMWPMDLSPVDFSIQKSTVEYATCTIGFAYTKFKFI